jgi:hypothetical protein
VESSGAECDSTGALLASGDSGKGLFRGVRAKDAEGMERRLRPILLHGVRKEDFRGRPPPFIGVPPLLRVSSLDIIIWKKVWN